MIGCVCVCVCVALERHASLAQSRRMRSSEGDAFQVALGERFALLN